LKKIPESFKTRFRRVDAKGTVRGFSPTEVYCPVEFT